MTSIIHDYAAIASLARLSDGRNQDGCGIVGLYTDAPAQGAAAWRQDDIYGNIPMCFPLNHHASGEAS